MDLNTLLTLTKIGGGITGLGGGFIGLNKFLSRQSRVGDDLAAIREDVHTIKTNHLPHLEEKIDKLNDRLTDHIVEAAKGHNA